MSKITKFIRKPSREDRFESVVGPHFDALYSAARRMTLSPDDAEDLVQEVCLKAFAKLEDLERMEFQWAWLLKVLYNLFIDDKRRSGRSPVDIAPTGSDSDEPDHFATNTLSTDELVDRDRRVQSVLRAMRYLNAEQCALVAMHDVEGLTIEELCELTGMPAGTIKSQLYRTRLKLGRLLSNDVVSKPHLKIVGGKQ